MPDFDKNMQPIIREQGLPNEEIPLILAPKPAPMLDPGKSNLGPLTPNLGNSGATFFDKMRAASANSDFSEQGRFVTNATLEANKRYDAYNPEMESMEDFYGNRQSFLEKGKNGVLKGLNLAATTVAGGYAMLGGAAYAATVSHKLSDIWDNPIMRAMDDWNEKMDQEYLPNYYTDREKNADWYETDNWATGNFLFDKVIKNAGYAVGAMYSGNMANAFLSGAGARIGAGLLKATAATEASQAFKLFTPMLRNTARAFSSGANAEVYGLMQKELGSIADLEARSSALANLAKTTNKFAQFGDKARRTAIAAYSSAGEASFEALQTSKEYRNNLIEEYKSTHNGAEPEGEALKEIDEYSQSVGEKSFYGNLALLGLTEYGQLNRLLGSTYAAERQAANSLMGAADDVALREGKWMAAATDPTSKFGKLYKGVVGVGKYFFDPKEAGQEIGQYALQIGAQNYYKKAYQGEDASVWTDGFLYGMFGVDERGAKKGAFVSKEGWESGLLGGLTGGPMQARATFIEGKERKSNTAAFIESLDRAPSMQEAFKDKLNHANRQVVLQQQQQNAVINGDELEARDLNTDMLHNYLAPRIKYGRFDMIKEDLKELRVTDNEALKQLVDQGIGSINDTKESFNKKLDKIETYAKNLDELYRATNLTYSGRVMTDETGKPIPGPDGKFTRRYSPAVIDKMVYSASKIADYETRIPQVNASLVAAGVPTHDVLQNIIENNKPNMAATQEALAHINKLNVTSDVKDKLKTNLSDIIEMSMRRQSYIQEYDDIKDNPLNYVEKDEYRPGEKADMPVEVVQEVETPEGSEEVKQKLEVGKEYSLQEPLVREGSNLIMAPKMTVLAHTLGGEIEVKMPDGKSKFLTPEEFKKYNISEMDNKFPELEEMLMNTINDVLGRPEFAAQKKEFQGAKNKDLDSMLFTMSTSEDTKLQEAIEKEFNDRYNKFMAEARARAEREALFRKRKEDWVKAQAAIEQKSGTAPGIDTTTVNNPKENPRKDADVLYKSSTTESEDLSDPTKASPHIKRARLFLNKIDDFKNRKNIRAILVHANNAKELGLEGIVQLAYGRDLDTPVTDIQDSTDVNKGFLAQVYMVLEGKDKYFVDEQGNKITKVGEQADLDKVVFQTMPTTELTWSNGEARHRSNQKDEAEGQSAGYAKFRSKLFASNPTNFDMYEIKVSKGFAIENTPREFNQVGDVLIDNDRIATEQTIIDIPTKGTVAHGGENFNYPDGVPVFKFGSKIVFLNNRNINDNQANALYETIKTVTDKLKDQLVRNQPIYIESPELDFIQNVLYWNKKKTDSPSAIQIDEENMNLIIGGKSFPLTEIALRKDEILDQLKKAWFSTNNTTIKKYHSEPFTEFYMDGDVLKQREWTNYQSYLLSNKHPDGSARSAVETPLTTAVAKPTPEIPYSFAQKYSILQDLEYEVPAPKTKPGKQPAPPTTTGVDVVTVDGTEIALDVKELNKLNLPIGEVEFTVSLDNGKPDVTVMGGKGLEDFLEKNKDEVPANVIKTLGDGYDADGTVKDNLTRFVEFRIAAMIYTEIGKSGVKKRAPQQPPAPPVTVPVVIDVNGVATTLDGKTENTIKDAKIGDIKYTASLDATGSPVVEITGGDGYNDFVKKNEAAIPAPMQAVMETLGIYDEDASNADNLKELTNARVRAALVDALKKKQAPAPTVTRKPIEILSTDDKDLLYNQKVELEAKAAEMSARMASLTDDESAEFKEINSVIRQLNGKLVGYKPTAAPAQVTVVSPAGSRLGNLGAGGRRGAGTPFNNQTSGIGNAPDPTINNVPFRLMGVADRHRMTEEELEIFKDWAAEKLPLIPYEVLENIIQTNDGRKAWGVFENGVAKFVKGGLRGTEYHEVGEAIWNGLLTEKEQQDLLDEFKAKQGAFTDRETLKRILYSEATDNQAKERILDDFADFRVGKLPARNLAEKIGNFFQRIINFFRSFVNQPSLKDQLFNAIEAGEFKEKALPTGIERLEPQYRAVEGLNETETHMFVEDMLARAAGILSRDGQKDALYSPAPIDSEEVWDEIWDMYEEGGKSPYLTPTAWSQLKDKVRDRLRTLGYSMETENPNINTEGTNKNDYTKETFAPEGKNSATKAVKFSTATLIERESIDQGKSSGFERPKPKQEKGKLGFLKLVNFNKVYSTLLDRISNTSSVSKFVDKLVSLANDDGNFVSTFERVGGNLADKTIPFSQFKFSDWRFFIDYMQSFGNRQKPDALIQYKRLGETYTGSANLFNASRLERNKWMENMRALAKDKEKTITLIKQNQEVTLPKLISYDRLTQTYVVSSEALKSYPIKTKSDMTVFLQALGIEFTMSTHRKLKTDKNKNEFANAVSGLHRYIADNPSVMTLSGKILNVEGHINKIAELFTTVESPNQDPTYFGVEGQRVGSYSENNVPSVFENVFNEVEDLEELKELMPQLKDIFSDNSQILKLGGMFFNTDGTRTEVPLKVKYIQGTQDLDNNKGVSTSGLGTGERMSQEINQNLNGDYFVLIPADGTTEWMINLGNVVTFRDFNGTAKRANDKKASIFKGYLIDDVKLALDDVNRSRLKNIKGRATQLRFFKDFLSSTAEGQKLLDKINEKLNDKVSTFEDVEPLINDNMNVIMDAVNAYIENTVAQTKENLMSTNQMDNHGEELELYNYKGLNTQFAIDNKFKTHEMSEDLVNQVLRFANTNYIINNIEYHKILFGDPYQFKESKGKLDLTKRIKSFLSPRRTTFDHPEFNSFLNREMNMVGDIVLKKGDPGYHDHKSYANATVLADNNILGSLTSLINLYGETNETDGFSILMDNTYREIKMKNKQWDDTAEAFHQWQMAFTRQNMPGYKYTDAALKAHDELMLQKECPKHHIEVLKPIVTGSTYNKNEFHTILHKMSQMPIYYSMVQGTTMEKFYTKMMDQGMGYGVFESGAKVGIETTHPLYNGNGTFNDEAFNNTIQVPWTAYGIQVETTSEGEHSQTRGSQLTKMATMDIFNNGQIIGNTPERQKEIMDEYNRNKEMLDLMHENAYNELLNNLSIQDLGDNYVMTDGRSVAETLMREMLRRNVSDNAKESLELTEDNQFVIPFEASPAYDQMRKIIYSMIDKALVSPKMSGGAHVQVPVTMFEDAKKGRRIALKTKDENGNPSWKHISRAEYETLSDEEKKNVAITDDTLKFYSKEDPYCEILVPHWFKNNFPKKKNESDREHEKRILNYLNTPEGKKILSGIGFRIPTQALSSVEVFRVKGFLPQYMGHTVVVPSEITSKAGSDFDIDKLNMYLKSIYLDANGNMRLVEYKGSEEATKEFYAKVYEDTKAKQIADLGKFDEFREKLLPLLGHMSDVEGQSFDLLSTLTDYDEEQRKFVEFHKNIIGDIIEQANEKGVTAIDYLLNQVDDIETEKAKLTEQALKGKLKDDFIKTNYKKSLENEYYDSLEKLITLPEVFDRLIKPVDDAGLSVLAAELDELRGYDESTIKNRTLDRNYMTNLRHSFVVAKKWVGIAAANITSLALKQKAMVYINPERFEGLSVQQRSFLGDGVVQLDHNAVYNAAGHKFISLSGTHTHDGGELISDRYSGYATAFVDVAKDPFIMKIIQSDTVVGMFMFLENIGVGKRSAYFMAQPIIVEYLKLLEKRGSKNIFSKKNIAEIRAEFRISGDHIQQDEGLFNQNNLKRHIEDYYKDGMKDSLLLDDNFIMEQSNIFDEFLKYAVMADQSFQFTQSMTYDTTRVTNGDHFARKQWDTDRVRNTNIITSVDEVLDKSHIGKQKDTIDKAMQSMSAIFKLEQRELVAITQKVLKPYAANKFISEDEFNKIANKLKSSFMDYIITTANKLNMRIEELVVSDVTSAASRLADLKLKYPENELLKSLEVEASVREGGAKTIKLNVNVKEAYDENRFTGMMREMRDTDQDLRDFYYDLLDISIIQGTSPSAVSIRNIIPIEDFAAEVAPIMSQLQATPELDVFSRGYFQRNNFGDNKIVPTVTPNFELEDEYIDEYGEERGWYTSKNFPDYPSYGISSNDRKILFLSEKTNSAEVEYEVIKIPRVIGDVFTDRIDLKTGATITDNDYIQRKKIGDYTLNDFYGYQKVRYASGEAVKKYNIKNDSEQYIYKLVNLLGDGNRASEYYTDIRPSVINNPSVKVEVELTDDEVIEIINAKKATATIKEKVPLETIDEIEDAKEFTNAMLEYVEAQKVTRGYLKIDGQNYYIDKNLQKTIRNAEGGYDFYIYPNGKTNEDGEYDQLALRRYIASSYPGSTEFFSDEDEGRAKAAERKPGAEIAARPAGVPLVVAGVEKTTSIITRDFVKANPNTLFLFGDNDIRTGLGGQAKEMRGEPNTIGISTKKLPSNEDSAFKTDSEYDNNKFIITNDVNRAIKAAKSGRFNKVVIPPIGVGLAKLEEKAPMTYAFLQKELDRLEKEVTEVTTPTSTNIYAGTGENSDLSNFAVRPFKFYVQQNNRSIGYMGERNFQSVEQAFQWHKVQYSQMQTHRVPSKVLQDDIDRNQLAQEILNTTDGKTLRELGRRFKLDNKAWDKDSNYIMKTLLKASFEQNPQALQRLLATGNEELTHTQDKGKWGTEFPKLLMEVRSELAKVTPVTPPTTSTEYTSSDFYDGGTGQRTEEASRNVWNKMAMDHPFNPAFTTTFEEFKELDRKTQDKLLDCYGIPF